MIDSGRRKLSERDWLEASISPDSLDYVAFHGPYGKFVQKATACMFESVDQLLLLNSGPTTYISKEIEKTFMKLSLEIYKQKPAKGLGCLATAVN
ncbi:hypothetical protein BY996DRAFT_6576869 [Phakopsora pachyrhizi]|uniref:Hydroxymethylglutaryl-coenzyme A synthase C-terminal domain-containing protein n=1 Tax=Phakopsora pachyrhizi TaxID=170000 RepID=A0AAV0AUS4_PHAPC|nr:hypothetical protein BY996DRAFT_6576869 [Phakopsora pachyrhizi]CAH7673633.1 hypothetical protein PPACK8108_LOCUS8515 [Phakopsora pachyrhizi]